MGSACVSYVQVARVPTGGFHHQPSISGHPLQLYDARLSHPAWLKPGPHHLVDKSLLSTTRAMCMQMAMPGADCLLLLLETPKQWLFGQSAYTMQRQI